MDGFLLELCLGGAAGLMAGGIMAWWLRGRRAEKEFVNAEDNWQRKLRNAETKAHALDNQTTSLQVNLEETQALALASRHEAVSRGTEVESIKEKLKAVAVALNECRAERDEAQAAAAGNAEALAIARERLETLAREFEKSKNFYTGQIGNLIEQRKAAESKLANFDAEKESMTSLLASAKAEQDSLNRLLTSARGRLADFDKAEEQVIALEAENAELKHRCEKSEREAERLERRLKDQDDLRSQNQELAECLETVEDSRRQYEADARRYRDQYEKSEQQSETLRVKLGDIEARMNELQAASVQATEIARIPQIGISPPAEGEGDDLTEIVGIGKVFETMLHKLGIYYFRQIATFGPTELARINAELKEFKGRIEHDDWIGQARELHFQKYGMGGSLSEVN